MKYVLPRDITTVGMLIVLATIQVSAKNSQKTEEVSCQTISECEQLRHSIQAKIDELEDKSNLSKDEKRLRYNLRKQILSTQQRITTKQREIRAEEKAKTAKMLKDQNVKLEELKAMLQ